MNDIIARLKTELITQLNLVFTAILLWVSQQQNAPIEPILEYLPASIHGPAKIVLPILVGIVVQFAVELLKKRTAEQAVDAHISNTETSQ